MEKQGKRYTPRRGSKVAIAIEAIQTRPRTTRELGNMLECTCSAVRSMLLRPLSRGVIVKVTDDAGKLYFAMPQAAQHAAFTAAAVERKSPSCAKKRLPSPSPASVAPTAKAQSPAHPPAHRNAMRGLAMDAESPIIASFFLNGELTITANGECIRLDATQRQQLYSYLHKLRHVR